MNDQNRRASLGMLLRRSKSGDLNKGGKKAQALREAELERQRQASRVAPKLPEFAANNSERLSHSFSPELRPESPAVGVAKTSDSCIGRQSMDPPRNYMPKPPVPPLPNNGFDPYARTESMTHRGRYSYANSAVSTVNNPRRVRRRKDPTPFNILILGSRNAGKTSFLEFLKTALALPPNKRSFKMEEEVADRNIPSGNFIPHYLETEMYGERIGLTLWDSEGLEKNVVDLQLREMSAFLESKFEETFAEEMKVVRSPGVQDTHIHAAFLILDPARLDRNVASARNVAVNGRQNSSREPAIRAIGSLDEDLDIQVLRMLQGKTTVIPVIAKADTITTKHMIALKRSVWDSLKKSNMDPLEALGLDDDLDSESSSRIDEEDEEEAEREKPTLDVSESSDEDKLPLQGHSDDDPVSSPSSKRLSSGSIRRHKAQEHEKDETEAPFLPLSIISPDLYEPEVPGRQFPWGFADPYNEEHCDFVRLKEAVFSEWRAELREASREQWYEGWRTSRLKQRDAPYRVR